MSALPRKAGIRAFVGLSTATSLHDGMGYDSGDSQGVPMLRKSRAATDNPRNCAFCSEPLKQPPHRRDDRYFCNELCGDAASEPIKPLAAQTKAA
jgi:hypothetical protein